MFQSGLHNIAKHTDCGPGIALVQKAIGKKEGFRIHPSSMHNPEAHARPHAADCQTETGLIVGK